jgi:pyruvate-ferredoxin/flavodoxin oxidoreductase
VWIVGGDGWAYDIGYGGLDHVLASHKKVNVLVLDTEVYSNTGGQQSKATPLGAAAKFASAGKATRKKDLGLLAMSYGHVYVAEVAMQARSAQTVEAFLEAERHPGPSLIIAHSPCIAHGYDLVHSPEQQKRAIDERVWPLYRFDPGGASTGVEAPLVLDSGAREARRRCQVHGERGALPDGRAPLSRALRGARRGCARRRTRQRRALYEQLAHPPAKGDRPMADLSTTWLGLSLAAPSSWPPARSRATPSHRRSPSRGRGRRW